MPLPRHRGNELAGFRPLAEINVTPLVDVMLVLLIIFMVAAPMMIAGLDINLPKAAAARPLAPKEPLLVTVTRDNRYLLGSQELKAEDLVDAVRARLEGDASRAIYIQGDRETVYGNVIGVVDRLAAAGFAKIVMMADRKQPAAPGEAP